VVVKGIDYYRQQVDLVLPPEMVAPMDPPDEAAE